MDSFAFPTSLLFLFFIVLCHHQVHGSGSKCDIYKGKWVFDASYHPLYNLSNCNFLQKEFNCLNNGRPDHSYQNFRWQPTSCHLPRFNGTEFLRKFRGKRMMFVGDSLSLNQWQSLTCMLHTAAPQQPYISTRVAGISNFTFPAYGLSIMFLRNAFLVDIVNEKDGRVLKLNSIRGGQIWKGFDVLIFNSWHWWLLTGRSQPWDYVQDRNIIRKDMNRMVAYKKALWTWANWVNHNVDPAKTKVFFQGVSPDHVDSRDWADPTAKTCRGETWPVLNGKYQGSSPPAQDALKRVLRSVSKLVHLLDITGLSQLRKDGHPSAFGYGGHRGNDCSHWCLPGVPDTWNELLFAALIQS